MVTFPVQRFLDLQIVGVIFRCYMLLFSYFGLQDALAKANFAKKRNVKLDTSLREKLLQSCQLLRPHPKGKDEDQDHVGVKPFYPKQCHHFGICVCTKYPDSKWMFNNIARHFRIIFANKKKQPTFARTIMDKYGIVLRFSPDIPKSNKAETCLDDEWEIAYAEETNARSLSAVEDTGNLQDLFFHIGFMNYKTFHFSCQRLEMESMALEQHPQSVSKDFLWLTPAGAESRDDKRLEVYTDMELFAYLLDSKVPWTVTVLTFTTAIAGLDLLPVSSLPVGPLVEPFKVWHGSVEEASRRRLQEEREKAAKAAKERNRERKPKRNHGHTATCSRKTKRQRQALQSVEVDATESACHDDLLDIFDDLLIEDKDCDKNKDETIEVASEQDDIGNVYDAEDDDDDDGSNDNEIGGEEDQQSEAAASIKSALTEDDVDDLNVDLDDLNLNVQQEDLGDAAAVSRAPDEEHAPQTLELAQERPPVRRPREPGGARSSENSILTSLLMSHS